MSKNISKYLNQNMDKAAGFAHSQKRNGHEVEHKNKTKDEHLNIPAKEAVTSAVTT